jgi:tetratricopeptide (TPR) repeat protein
VAARKKDLAAAEVWLRKSLDLDPELMDAWRLLGKVLTRQSRRPEAIAAYEKYLKLALAGRRPLRGPIITQLLGPRLLDPDHFYVHARLARLYDQEGAVDRAINGYRMSIAAGWDAVFPRLRLACLYLKRGQRRQSLQEAWQAVKSIPRDLRNFYRRSYHRARLALRLNH